MKNKTKIKRYTLSRKYKEKKTRRDKTKVMMGF